MYTSIGRTFPPIGQRPSPQISAARAAIDAPSTAAPELPVVTGSPKVVVLGGTGRVGASTAAALLRAVPSASVSLSGRTREAFSAAQSSIPELENTYYTKCDVDDPLSIASAIRGADLVIHCAGPFQRREDCNVLDASIVGGVPYLDVCDATEYALRAKTYHEKAMNAGVPCITTAGIYPGVSNVMAAHMVAINRGDYSDDSFTTYRDQDQVEEVTGVHPKRILYSYFTAGSGGAGPTILETSLLLAGEDCKVYRNGQKMTTRSVSNGRIVDFGPGVGRRSVYLYPLPEVETGHRVMEVPSISARFGTDPAIWNWAMIAMARLVPKRVLSSRQGAKALGALAGPLVKAVDGFVGEKVAMLVEVELENGKVAAGLYVHRRLSVSVGVATSAFARCMLAGQTEAGVWWPEEKGALSNRRSLLYAASEGATKFVLNKPLWALESEPIQLGLGFYV